MGPIVDLKGSHNGTTVAPRYRNMSRAGDYNGSQGSQLMIMTGLPGSDLIRGTGPDQQNTGPPADQQN